MISGAKIKAAVFIMAGLAAIGAVTGAVMAVVNPEEDVPVCGGHHEYWDKSVSQEIKSEDITYFSFNAMTRMAMLAIPEQGPESCPSYAVRMEKDDAGNVAVEARGGGESRHRDGTRFLVKYRVPDDGLPAALIQLVRKYNLSRDNGHVSHTDGLPSGDGETLSVRFASGESIYRNNNVFPLLERSASCAIYETFRSFAKKQGYDFTTAGSSESVYDDPTPEMLQGAWIGKHFGRDCRAEFSGNRVRIWYDGELTDDTEYVIFEGSVKPNRLSSRSSPDDKYPEYDSFNAFVSISKKNDFTLVGHVYRNKSSSSVELLHQKN